MSLTENELLWAHQIKDAIASTAHSTIVPISDLECAQWAITSMGHQNLDGVLERVQKLQSFREQYQFMGTINNINPTSTQIQELVSTGMELIRRYTQEQQPGHLVTMEHIMDHTGSSDATPAGQHVIVWDRAKFSPSRVTTEEDWRVYQGCTYFLFLILTYNIQAMREGVTALLECDGMGYWNYDKHFEERKVQELFGVYPFVTHQFKFLHAPAPARLLHRVVQPLLSEELQRKMTLEELPAGSTEESPNRVDALFHQPTFEDAHERLMQRLEGYLTERLEHQATYVLPPKPPPDPQQQPSAASIQQPSNVDDDLNAQFAAAMNAAYESAAAADGSYDESSSALEESMDGQHVDRQETTNETQQCAHNTTTTAAAAAAQQQQPASSRNSADEFAAAMAAAYESAAASDSSAYVSMDDE